MNDQPNDKAKPLAPEPTRRPPAFDQSDLSGLVMPSVLNLTLKKQWFDLIKSGAKVEEYREIKTYWARRLFDYPRDTEWAVEEEMVGDMRNPARRHRSLVEMYKFFEVSPKGYYIVRFRNGYRKDSPVIEKRLKRITIGQGDISRGAPANTQVFILELQ
jgi:hypothetical protein